MPEAQARETHHILQPRPSPARLSLVIPMYNEEVVVDFLRAELENFMREVSAEMEVILVNDGSSDGTIEKIAGWAAEDRRIKVLQLSRNFGHQIASTAGLDYATGDAVVLIDADLQDPLPVVHQMIACYRQGYDVVLRPAFNPIPAGFPSTPPPSIWSPPSACFTTFRLRTAPPSCAK